MKKKFAAFCSFLAVAVSLPAASVIVNEINCKSTGSTPEGDWFEIVVVGTGVAYSTVDMRGWQFRVDNNGSTGVGYFKLSNDPYWGNVRAGTIITFHEDNAIGGGADTSILGTDNFTTEGWAHTNIYVQDPTYIDTAWGLHDPSFPIDNNDSQILIQDNVGSDVFGPAGEGHAGYAGGGVNSSEIFKLEDDPAPSITLTSAYNDGTTDTFGRPNEWGGGQNRQSFATFIPEPSSVILLALGCGTVLRRRR